MSSALLVARRNPTPLLEAADQPLDSIAVPVECTGLPDNETALRVESAAIELLGLESLTNRVLGWRSVQLGRLSLEELCSYYAPVPVSITEPALLIRINRLYRHGMTAQELYEATRGVWVLGPRRMKARLAFAVFDRIVREVYRIDSWHQGRGDRHRT